MLRDGWVWPTVGGQDIVGSWLRLDGGPNGSLGASMMQIDVDIFEPQGISKLDAQASFLPKEPESQLITKSFSGKKVCGMSGGGGGPPRLLSQVQPLMKCQA